MAKQFTWGEGVAYTFKTRTKWRKGNGRKPALTNTGHFTRLRGLSFPCTKITQPILTQLGIELEDEGKSDGTINRVISAVSTVLNHCASEDLIPSPPRFKRREEHEGRPQFYSKDQVDSMLHACIDPFMREDIADIIHVAAYTGMRQGELLKLKVKDIDLGLNVIHVGGRPDVLTKAHNYRTVPIHERIHSLLHKRLEHASPSVRVFDDWSNKDQLLRAFAKVRRYVGIDEGHCFHSLRHSFATWHVEAGTPLRVLMELMGHKRIETTLRYAKVTSSAAQSAMGAI